MADAGDLPRPDHVVIVIEENHAFSDIIGYAGAPYINSLAARGALFTNYFALAHPSQPNYIAMFSGSNQGVILNTIPPQKFDAPSLGGELLKAGFSFKAYSEDLPYPGYEGTVWEGYARRHAPWTVFSDVPADLHRPFTDFPTDYNDLPDVAFVIPNLDNGMHDGTVEQGDIWLRQHLDPYVQWAQAHNSLFVLTWDEDNADEDNRVVALFAGDMVKPGAYGGLPGAAPPLNHYDLLRTLEEMYGLPYLGASATARPMTEAFDPRPRVVGRSVFYNNSAFDGGSRLADERDDRAVAPDKHALRPGERASLSNYTSYSRGLNGVMVDVRGLPEPLTEADFSFNVAGAGRDYADPSWYPAPPPSAVATRRGAGRDGSDRVTLTWPDGAIRNEWLEVTVKANERTGLAAPDVFYFGNIVGDGVSRVRAGTANAGAGLVPPIFASVDAADLAALRAAVMRGGVCGLDSRFDHNRDGRVNALDLLIARAHLYRTLRLLAAPPAPVWEPAAARR